jgi:tetratricopeptide (TPR) repeat protein
MGNRNWFERDLKLGMRLLIGLAAFSLAAASQPRDQNRFDVEHYTINAEINPRTQSLTANVQVRFRPVDDNLTSAAFELNNAMTVSNVTDGSGNPLRTSTSRQDFTIVVNFAQPLPKGEPATVGFTYEGSLTGREESPVYGIKFAAIHPDYAYLLYPSRWFPINDYTVDSYTADMTIAVPDGFRVLASGIETKSNSEQKTVYEFKFTQPSFPGSIAVVKEEPVSVTAGGVTTFVFFRGESAAMANAYGEAVGEMMSFLTGIYGIPLQRNLTVVETEAGAPNGYAGPGMLFLSTRHIGKQANHRLLANQIARQWWGMKVSPATRNHLWMTNGHARYAELMWVEKNSGPETFEAEVRDTYIEAMTVEQPPVMQSSRLEDYSPEYWAVTAAKGAAILNMLRYVIGDEAFLKLEQQFLEQHPFRPVTTQEYQALAEQLGQRELQGFFIQWIESTGAPEFGIEYTVYRTQQGFRIMGKVTQDLDTFRMPVDLRIETEGNPEMKQVEVVGTSSEFVIDSFGRPSRVTIDPEIRVLRYSPRMRVAVAIRRGEMFAEISEFGDALKEYQRALDVNRDSSLAHYRVAEIFFLQGNYQSAANEFRSALNGDLEPEWVEVWSHINLGKIFDITNQRERAVNEYQLAIRTKDNTQGAQEEAAKYLQQPYERPARSY